MNFFLLEQYGEVTLVDVSLCKYRDTLETNLSVFDRKLCNPAPPKHANHREKEPIPCPQTP